MSVQGHFTYKSKHGHQVTAMQVPKALDVFQSLFNQVQFSRVIEIGSAFGGTTLMVMDALNNAGQKDCEFWTFDTNHKSAPPAIQSYIDKGENIKFFNYNVFNTKVHPWQIFDRNSDPVKFIQSSGRTLVLCDGGCKRLEFPVLSEFLKPGDHIMAHDYAKDVDYFNSHIKDKIWNWQEIKFSDVEKSFDTYNLETFMNNDFSSVAWLSARKKF